MQSIQPLPEKVQIVIVGGGLSGLALGAALGDAARDALLLEAGEPGSNDASLGFARITPAPPYVRIAASHGPERAAAAVAAGARNHELLEGLAAQDPALCLEHGGVVRLATGEVVEETNRSAEVLRSLGVEVRLGSPHEVIPSTPGRFVLAAHHELDVALDIDGLSRALLARALSAGLTVHAGTPVRRLEDNGGVRVETARGNVRAEVAVVAAGAEAGRLVPFCRFKIVGMRAQWVQARPHPDAAGAAPRSGRPLGWTDAEGHELWRAHGDGGVTVSGSRMLPVEKELAPRGGTSSEVQALLESNLREFPHLAAHRISARGAAVQAVPCDVLPLVGPVPGRPRVLLLAGFGRNSPGLALVAAEVVAQLLLSGRSEHAMAFSPRRFL